MGLLGNSSTKGWSKEAIFYLRKATGGDAVGQYEVGLRLLRGDEAPENAKEAISWLLKSAQQGYEDAEYLLGSCYMSGTGVEENEKVGLGFLIKAANAANKYAQHDLGEYYFSIDKFNTAVEWFKKAAKQEHGQAQFALGRCYYYGFGSVKSEKMAKEWLERAVDHGNKHAAQLLRKIDEDTPHKLL